MATLSPSRLPLSEIIGLPEFQTITSSQRSFISRYISSGAVSGTYDPVSAVKSAYKVSEKNAAGLASRLLAHKKIQRILDLHFGRTAQTEMDTLLVALAKAIKISIRRDMKAGGTLSVATMKAMQFYESHVAEAKRAAVAVAEPQEGETQDSVQKFAIGSVIEQEGKRYRVVATEIKE